MSCTVQHWLTFSVVHHSAHRWLSAYSLSGAAENHSCLINLKVCFDDGKSLYIDCYSEVLMMIGCQLWVVHRLRCCLPRCIVSVVGRSYPIETYSWWIIHMNNMMHWYIQIATLNAMTLLTVRLIFNWCHCDQYYFFFLFQRIWKPIWDTHHQYTSSSRGSYSSLTLWSVRLSVCW